MPLLLELPFKHKGVMCAPFIGPVTLEKYLDDGQVEQVICGGENYDGARPCHFDWVIKDGKRYRIPIKQVQSEMALKAGLNHPGKPVRFHLTDHFGLEIPECERYVPHYRPHCEKCSGKLTCNGCGDCGKCSMK